MRALLLAAVLLLGAEETPEREPSPAAAGATYAWKSKGGLRYEYRVPANYDQARGANLVFILHGTGLDRRWGFANHPAGEFRADDIVVSPDGPTPDGTARLFADQDDDLKALHDLQEEFRRAFKVRQVFVYGHSQGAFFAFLYAATFPKEVAGALGQAGGIWTNTPLSSANKHLPFVLMHGTADPVVPFSNSVGGHEFLLERGLTRAHLRAMEGWNHWPSAFHAAQQIAWMEGMTTDDPERAVAALGQFEKVAANAEEKAYLDFPAFRDVALRVAAWKGVPPEVRDRAVAASAAVEKLAAAHAEALRPVKEMRLEAAPWIGHGIRFLRDFRGVPAREDLAKAWAKTLDQHRDRATDALRVYFQNRGKDPKKAFEAGVRAVRDGFLHYECADPDFLAALAEWAKDPKKAKPHEQFVAPYADALKQGLEAYAALNRGF